MNAIPYGRLALSYIKDNAASLAGGVAVTIGGAAIAAAGAKAVTTTCLIGGGLVSTFIAHEVATRTFQMLGKGVKRIRHSFKEQPTMRDVRRDREPDSGTIARP